MNSSNFKPLIFTLNEKKLLCGQLFVSIKQSLCDQIVTSIRYRQMSINSETHTLPNSI